MTNRLANPQPQFFDDSGNPLAGGKLYSYVTNTSTLASTYSDSTLTTPNSNPITLDSAGRSPTDIFLDPAVTYRFVLKNSTESQTFWTKDKVADPAASVAAAVQVYNGDPNGFVAGNAGTVGGSGASLVYDITNERLYVCITTGNAAAAVWQYIYDPISGQEDVRTNDHTITVANRGRTQVANKASAITFTLPAVATIGAGLVVPVKNIGAGALTIDGNAAETIDGATTITLGQYESAILYCNGATWRTLGRTYGPAEVLLTSGTLSAAATCDIVLTTYTAFRRIRFVLSGFLPATDGAQLYMRFSTDGGSTYLASGYNYATVIASDASAVSGAGSGSANQITMTGSIGNATTEGINSEIEILNQTSTAFWPRVMYRSYYIDNAGTPGAWFVSGGGAHESAIDVDAVRFLFSTGNIAEGKYAVYGLP